MREDELAQNTIHDGEDVELARNTTTTKNNAKDQTSRSREGSSKRGDVCLGIKF